MQRSFLILLVCGLVLLSGVAVGQLRILSGVSKPAAFANSFQLTPQVVPSTTTDLSTLVGGPAAGRAVYICEADFSTKGSTGTITLQDNQGTPVPLAFAVPIAINTTYSFLSAPSTQTCRYFPAGATVSSGSSNTVWMYISGYWQ